MKMDEDGDIRMHGQEGIYLVFMFTNEDGSPKDVTTSEVWFRTPDFDQQLVAGATVDEMLLVVQEGTLPPAYLGVRTPYVIIDETGDIPQVILSAELMVSGWL